MVERQTAITATVAHLLSGEYIQKEGWAPNFIRSNIGELSRANVVGVIIQAGEQPVLDDGSGQIRLQTFNENVPSFAVGDVVLVIGRPREYAGTRFLNYEILRQIPRGWLEYRKKELALFYPVGDVESNELPIESPPTIEDDETLIVQSSTENLFAKLLDIIRQIDVESGNQGAGTDAVLEKANHPEAEHILTSLLEEGEVFEIRPGKVKVLE